VSNSSRAKNGRITKAVPPNPHHSKSSSQHPYRQNQILSIKTLKVTAILSAAIASLGTAVYLNTAAVETLSWSNLQPEIANFFRTCQLTFTNFYDSIKT